MPGLQALEGIPSFGTQLGQSLGGGLSEGIGTALSQLLQQKQQRKQGTALAEYLGKPELASQLAQLPLELQKEVAKSHFGKQQEFAMNKENAIRSIEEMRQIIDRGNTGKNYFTYLTEEGRGDRAALDTAALNIERLAADMVGKGTLNQERFKYLKERLPSSSKTDAENRSILDEWEKILGQGEQSQNASTTTSKEKMMFDPANPKHQAKAWKLHKTLKDKDKVRKQLEREFNFDAG
jgi:hypothetical protein